LFNGHEKRIDGNPNTNVVRRSSFTYRASNVNAAAYALALKRVIASALAISRVAKHCPCPQYRWSGETAPMWKYISFVKNIIKGALHQQYI